MTYLAPTAMVGPATRLRGSLELPADKSIGHRALIVNALAGGPAMLEMRSPGEDVLSTIACLRAIGVAVEAETGPDGRHARFSVSGRPDRNAVVDCGNSGTTMRLLAGALAGLPLEVTLDGDASLRRRPMERVATLLRATGAVVTTTDGRAPITVRGRQPLAAVEHRLPVASAQLVGCAALAGLAADGTTRVVAPGETRDHTERMLAAAGVGVRREGLVTTLDGPARPRPLSLRVPGDVSAAAPWLVAAAIHPHADLALVGVGLNPTRTALIGLLRRMGADIEIVVRSTIAGEPVGDIRARGGTRLHAVEVPADEAPGLIDELPLVAVAMAAADGTSEVRGAGELRVKESDRVAATVAGLRAIGASVDELPDGWRVSPGAPRAARISAEGDHRIAIAFAIAALAGVAQGVELDDPACVSISYRDFWDDLALVQGTAA